MARPISRHSEQRLGAIGAPTTPVPAGAIGVPMMPVPADSFFLLRVFCSFNKECHLNLPQVGLLCTQGNANQWGSWQIFSYK